MLAFWLRCLPRGAIPVLFEAVSGCVAEHSRGLSKQSSRDRVTPPDVFVIHLGELDGGKFRSGSENGLSLIPADQQSRCNLIMKICPSSFGHLSKQVQ